MVAKIIASILGIAGAIMTAVNYEYIRYSSYINTYSEFEKLLLDDYIQKGNYAIIGLCIIIITLFILIREKVKSNKSLYEALEEYKEEIIYEEYPDENQKPE